MNSKKEELTRIKESIEKISLYYEMSDSPLIWEMNTRLVDSIKARIKHLTLTQLLSVVLSLNDKGLIIFGRYFGKEIKDINLDTELLKGSNKTRLLHQSNSGG